MPATSDPPLKRRNKRVIGAFPYLVMMSIKVLGPKAAYGHAISEYLTNKLRQIVDNSQTYVALERLSKQGMVSDLTLRNPNDSGHEVKIYSITKKGREECKRAAGFYNHLYVQEGYWN